MGDKTDANVDGAEAPKFVGGAARRRSVTLDFPLTYAGKLYEEIVLQRMTAREVAVWIESIRDKEETRFPIYRDDAGDPIPDIVLDSLDDDDQLKLEEAARDFLPRRFRDVQEIDSGPAAGGTTAP